MNPIRVWGFSRSKCAKSRGRKIVDRSRWRCDLRFVFVHGAARRDSATIPSAVSFRQACSGPILPDGLAYLVSSRRNARTWRPRSRRTCALSAGLRSQKLALLTFLWVGEERDRRRHAVWRWPIDFQGKEEGAHGLLQHDGNVHEVFGVPRCASPVYSAGSSGVAGCVFCLFGSTARTWSSRSASAGGRGAPAAAGSVRGTTV